MGYTKARSQTYARIWIFAGEALVTGLGGRLTVFLVFALSRLAIFSSDQRESTLSLVNVRYAVEAQRAAYRGMSLYQLHEETRRLEDPSSPAAERAVEYPPLAILWMRATTFFLDPVPPTGAVPDSWVKSAERANRIALFLVDLAGYGLLAVAGASAAQLAVYVMGGVLLFPLLYDRLDLLLGVLLLGAMVLLLRRREYWPPLLVLALAINFKVTPLVLVPLFVLGSLPAEVWPLRLGRRILVLAAKRLACLALFGALVFVPFLVRDGFATLGFLSYHAQRGLEIASVWNTLPIALGAAFRWPVSASLRFGAVELDSALSGALRTLSSVCTALVIPALTFGLWKLLARPEGVLARGGARTLAQANPRLFVRCAIVCLLTAILPAPVLSPQYLLWLVPLFALWEGRRQWAVCGVFLVICTLTTLHFPFLTSRVLGVLSVDEVSPLWARLLWPAPLICRNLLLVGFTAWLWLDTFREPASGRSAEGGSPPTPLL